MNELAELFGESPMQGSRDGGRLDERRTWATHGRRDWGCVMKDLQSKLSRRRVFAGVGALGALAAAAAAIPVAKQAETVVPEAKPEADQAGGYRLTAHVQRYYETTKV